MALLAERLREGCASYILRWLRCFATWRSTSTPVLVASGSSQEPVMSEIQQLT